MPKQTVTTSAVALTSYEINDALILKADSANTDTLYFGYSNTITAGTTDATDGMPLAAGESYVITPYRCGRSSGNVYVRCASGSPKVYYEPR